MFFKLNKNLTKLFSYYNKEFCWVEERDFKLWKIKTTLLVNLSQSPGGDFLSIGVGTESTDPAAFRKSGSIDLQLNNFH